MIGWTTSLRGHGDPELIELGMALEPAKKQIRAAKSAD